MIYLSISLSPPLKVGMKIVKSQFGSSNPEKQKSRRCNDLVNISAS